MKASEHSAKEIPTVELEEIVRTGRCPETYAIILAQAELDRRGEGKAEEGEGMKASEITKNELVKVSQNYPDPYVRKMAMELLDRRGEKAVEPDVNFYNGIEWFACWLIDHAEGETITEEQVRPWAIEAWNKHIAKPASEVKEWMCVVCFRHMTEAESKGYAGCPTGMHPYAHIRIRNPDGTDCEYDARAIKKPTPPAKPEPVEPLPETSKPEHLRKVLDSVLEWSMLATRRMDALEAVVRKSDDVAWVDLSMIEKLPHADALATLLLAIEQIRHCLKAGARKIENQTTKAGGYMAMEEA